ncbi:hypothetical protein [Nocardioides sp.]|uniref:hypothetical protein n=1 Tax=Nocardioides sp. TaxID=35761 RepID=UPI00261AF071|nr:hypothetical protein [Nocardioides sp.]
MTTPELSESQRPSGAVLLGFVSACAAVVAAVLLGVDAAHPLSDGLFCWGSLAVAAVGLVAALRFVPLWLRSLPVGIVGAVALLAFAAAVVDATDAEHSAAYLTAALAAGLAVQAGALESAASVVVGPREWPRYGMVVVLAVLVLASGVWLALKGASSSTYDVALAVALGVAPAPLAVAVLAPLAIGAARARRRGVVIRHTSAAARSAGVRSLVLDGIGTLVAGKHVASVDPLDETHLRNLRWFAGALAHAGEDPMSRAIARLAVRGNLTDVAQSASMGLSGNVDRHPVRLADPEVVGLEPADVTLVPGHTVGVEVDLRPLGTIRVEDTVRAGASDAVATLVSAGIEPVLISAATGPTASAIMGETGVNHLVERTATPSGHDVTRALGLCKDPAPTAAAVVSPRPPDSSEVFHLGPDSDVFSLDEASIEHAALALGLGRAIWSVTRRARTIAIAGQGLVTLAALAGVLPPWGAAIGAGVVSGLLWGIVALALPGRGEDG